MTKTTVGILSVLILALPVLAEETAQGQWTKKGYSIAGSWSIVEEDGERFLVLSEDFKTKKAPDLKLFLSKRSLARTDNRNATDDTVFLGKLESARGKQRYPIPASVDLSEYRTLLLHCEKYSKLWGGATIR